MDLDPDGKLFLSRVDRFPAVISAIIGLPVIAFWWLMVWLEQMEYRPPTAEVSMVWGFAVCGVLFFLGPLAGVGAALCARRVYLGWWRYAFPCLVGAIGFIVNGVFVVVTFAIGV
jgi:hypothetical protein